MRTRISCATCTGAGARALCDHPRNLRDEQLRALAGTGGVVGLNAWHEFIDSAAPSLDRLLDHAAHMAGVMGPGHVGLGLDLLEYLPGYEDKRLPGLTDASEAPAITAGLRARSVSDGEIRGLPGENWLRVWRQVLVANGA